MLRRLLPVGIVISLVAGAQQFGFLWPLHDALIEYRMRAAPRAPTGAIVLVDIDSRSLKSIGRWPWPRGTYAAILDGLREMGAAEVALDIDLSDASEPGEDTALERALERAGGSVVLATLRQRRTGQAADEIVYTDPLPRFAARSWPAIVSVRPDPDGAIRQMPFGEWIDETYVPSMAATLGGDGIPRADRAFLVDFSIDAGAITRVSAIDVIERNVSADLIAGRKAIVGAEAIQLGDIVRIPAYGFVSGSTLQALATETLLQARDLLRTGPLINWTGLMLIAAAFVLAIGRISWRRLLTCIAIAAVVVEAGALAVQILAPVSVATAAWLVTLGALALLVLLREIDVRRLMLLISRRDVRNTRTILDRVIEDNVAGIIVADENGTVRVASKAAERILAADGLVGRSLASIAPPALEAAMSRAICDSRTGVQPGALSGEIALTGTEPPRFLEYVVTPSRLLGDTETSDTAHGGRHIACATFTDVTERKLAEAQIRTLARFDTLTGLLNRNGFVEALAVLSESAEGVAVLCIDVDRFQNVNHALGYEVGDRLLVAVGERLKAIAGAEAAVARFGGDDFVVAFVGNDSRQCAEDCAGALIARVGDAYAVGNHRIGAGLSVGLARADRENGASLLSLLRAADRALGAARQAGGNRVAQFEPSMLAGVKTRQDLELALWEALHRDEFEVLFQPQVTLGDGRLFGAEALLRWRRPGAAEVPPSEFIPVAEAIGLIEPLGAWVLNAACAAAAKWPEPLSVSVNVSAAQFGRGDLVRTVIEALAASGLPAGRLELEITESLLMANGAAVTGVMHELTATGVSFALDDFGTGYSGLGYLSRLPIGKIKLDRSFTTSLPCDAPSVSIVQGIGMIARDLNVTLIAEGIETLEQAALLRLLGCSEGQGYLFGKPMPALDFVEHMANARLTVDRTTALAAAR